MSLVFFLDGVCSAIGMSGQWFCRMRCVVGKSGGKVRRLGKDMWESRVPWFHRGVSASSCFGKRTQRSTKRSGKRDASAGTGSVAQSALGPLRSCTVGALPVINDLLKRMRLEEFLQTYLPPEDPRCKLSAAKTLLVLLRNLLLSREPLYGLGEWAARYAPDLFGLSAAEVSWLNDDRAGRAADRLFLAEIPALVLEVALLERELRRAMQREEIEALPMYPEGRACRWPTARRLLDLFESVQRHTLSRGEPPEEVIVTERTNLQRRLLKLLGLSPNGYGH